MNEASPTTGEILFVIVLAQAIAFAVGVALTRWIFKVNTIVRHLEEIGAKLDDFKKQAPF